MDIILQLVDKFIAAIPPELFRGLGVAIITVPSVWAFIEHVLPPTSTALKNHGTNILGNTAVYVGLHASNTVTFGTGWHGYLAAGIFSVLGFGAVLVFHKGAQRFTPGLTRPANGG